MSKITDAIDAAGRVETVLQDFGSLVAATDAEAAAAGALALREGSSAQEAAARALGGEAASTSRELIWSFEASAVAGFTGGEEAATRQGSYRGHDIIVLDSALGVDLLQALAMLDELPLTDLGEGERALHLSETLLKVRDDATAGLSTDERLDPDHIEALLDASPPDASSKEPSTPVGRQAAVVGAGGDVVIHRAAEGPPPLIVLRGGRPFLALGLDGDPLEAPLRFLLAFIDLSLSLEEASERAESAGIVALMIDDEYARHSLGVAEGITSGQS